MFIDSLIDYALSKISNRTVKDIRAGLGYSCVVLEDNACGLAYTFTNELGECCGILDEAGGLLGINCAEVIPWAGSSDRLKASLGLASINAVLNDCQAPWETGNVISALDIKPSNTFGMIGEFRPILAEIRKKTNRIFVFEQHRECDAALCPSETIPDHLPKCDVVVVTSTSIINHTFEEIMPYCANARQVCMVGPSTPLCPEVFKGYNVTLLAGVVVTNQERILQVVSQAGGTMHMKGAVKQVLVRV
jgi:uncharacterized protein (DUF4213/DUF364 family)